MTIEDLAELTSDKLKALSNDELTAILSPYFTVTRPELVVRKTPERQQAIVNISPEKRAALALMSEEGIDLSFLRKRKK